VKTVLNIPAPMRLVGYFCMGFAGELCPRNQSLNAKACGTRLRLDEPHAPSLRDFRPALGDRFRHDEDTRLAGCSERRLITMEKVTDHCGVVSHLFTSGLQGIAIQGAQNMSLNSAATPEGLEIGTRSRLQPNEAAGDTALVT